MKKFGVALLCIIGIDQLLKWYVHTSIPLAPSRSIPLFHISGIDCFLAHVTNLGGAWGILSSVHIPLLIFRIALIGVLLMAFFRGKERRFPLLLVIAGAFSNVLDFLMYGHVVDMFHFILWGYSFPVFNIADISICVGIGLLFLRSFTRKQAHGSV